MSPAPETMTVTPRGLRLYGALCGGVGALLALFVYGLAVARQAPMTSCQTPASLSSGIFALRDTR